MLVAVYSILLHLRRSWVIDVHPLDKHLDKQLEADHGLVARQDDHPWQNGSGDCGYKSPSNWTAPENSS